MCLEIPGGLAATPPPGMGFNAFCILGKQLQANFCRDAAPWLKISRVLASRWKMFPDRTRVEPQRQRRLITRLSVSIESLLRLRLGLQPISGLRHAIPIHPIVVQYLLERLSEGIGELELLHLFEASENE